jgi:peroxiredoxin
MAEHQDTNKPTSGDSGSATVLPAGTVAPDFTLQAEPDRSVTLAELRGKPVVLAFYPADWSPVCGDQMALYNEILPDFREQGAELLGISVDGAWCHKAFAEARKLRFPLLADFEPKGAVSRAYGAYDSGVSQRALFVIDAAGIIRWSYLSPIGVNPGADGILAALERLTPEQRGAKGTGATAPSGSRASESSASTDAGAAR